MRRSKKVRFIEHRKAERRLKSALKSATTVVAADHGTVKEMKRRKHIAEVDLNYAKYYPLERKYVALFADSTKSGATMNEGDDEEGEWREERGDPEMWRRIEKAMEEGQLDAVKNELTLFEEIDWEDGKKGGDENDGDESDGEFFE